jgi:HAD superfamily hydrolase (TIGR01549 family)
MLPKLVLFDLDDTLYDHVGTVERALAETARANPTLASRPLPELVAENQRVLEGLHVAVCAGTLDVDEARLQRIQRLFDFCGAGCSRSQAEEVAAVYRPAYQANQRAVDGARELLEGLHGRTQIGIVTNNMTAEQVAKLRIIGLDDLVGFMVTSEDAGIVKPEPGIYLQALDIAGLRPEDAVFVGDAWENDVVGPQAVGIRAVWLSHGRTPPTAPEPFAIAPTLAEVGPILERMA